MSNDQDTQKKIEELHQKINALSTQSWWSKVIQRKTSFTVGFTFALIFTSVIAYALTKPHTFVAGTAISATEVNANFDVLYDAVTKLNRGFLAVPSVDFTINCSTSAAVFEVPGFDQVERTDTGFDEVLAEYTVTEGGYFRLYMNYYVSTGSFKTTTKVLVNGVERVGLGNNSIFKLATADLVKFEIACDNKKGATTTFGAAESYLGVVPL